MTRKDKDDFTTLITILNDCDFESDNVYIEFENPIHAEVGNFQFSLGGYNKGYVFAYNDEDFLRVNFDEEEIEILKKDLDGITDEAILILGAEHYKDKADIEIYEGNMDNTQIRNECENLAKRLRITQKENRIDLQTDYKAFLIINPLEYPCITLLEGKTFSGLPVVICKTIAQSTLGNVPYKVARTFEDCSNWSES